MSIFKKRTEEERVQDQIARIVKAIEKEKDTRVVAAALSCVLGNFCWNAKLPVDRAVDSVVGTYRSRKKSQLVTVSR